MDNLQEHPRSADLSFQRWNLDHLVKAWAAQGRPLPVAVVVSIFDDLCEALALAPPGDDVVASLEHVIIDQAGVARLTKRPKQPVRAVSGLLREVLAGASGDEAIPAAAWPILGQGLADDPWIRPPSTDVMQALLRDALGPPAAREEVVGSCSMVPTPALEIPSVVAAAASDAPQLVTAAPAPIELVTVSPQPIVSETVSPQPLPSAPPAPSAARSWTAAARSWLEERRAARASQGARASQLPAKAKESETLPLFDREPAQRSERPSAVEVDLRSEEPARALTAAAILSPPAAIDTAPLAPAVREAAAPIAELADDAASTLARSAVPAADAAPIAAVLPVEPASMPAIPAADTAPVAGVLPWQIAAIPAAATAPIAAIPAAETAPIAAIPAAEMAPVAAIPAAETAPVAAIPAAETAPVAAIPAAETAPLAALAPAPSAEAAPAFPWSKAGTRRSVAPSRTVSRPSHAPAPLVALAPPPPDGTSSARPPSVSIPPTAPLAPATAGDDAEGPPSLLPRPVVRHEPARRRPVSLPAAPAARLGTASLPPPETAGIRLPAEARSGQWILILLTLATVGLLAWLLGLV